MLEDKVIIGIAENHGKTAAQILLKYLVQQNIIVIPKSTNEKRIRQNFEVISVEHLFIFLRFNSIDQWLEPDIYLKKLGRSELYYKLNINKMNIYFALFYSN